MEILNRLNRSYPIAETEIERGVHELLGPINKRIVRAGGGGAARGRRAAARRADDRGAGATSTATPFPPARKS